MASRRQAREYALQALYQCDALDEWTSERIEIYFELFQPEEGELCEEDRKALSLKKHGFSYELCHGVMQNLAEVDAAITFASENWSLSRMSRVDRNILRIGTYEIVFLEDVPPNVSINEGIEIAKRYGTDDSPHFINGVLDRVAAEAKKGTFVRAAKVLRA